VKGKLSRTTRVLVLIFVTTLAVLCVSTVYVPKVVDDAWATHQSYGGLFIIANELLEKPQTYHSLTNPDSYILQAITSLKEAVHIGSTSNSQTYQIIESYGDGFSVNVEYNNHYYSIAEMWGTPTPPEERILIPILIASWIIWSILAIITVVVLIVFKKRKG
jgi:hypothetical protein